MIDEIILGNIDTGASIIINKSDSQYALETVDWGSIPARHATYLFVNQLGAGISSTSLGVRDISITGWAYSNKNEAELSQLKDILKSLVNPLHMLKISALNYMIIGHPTSTVKFGSTDQTNNEIMCKFLVSLSCPDPLFEYGNESIGSFFVNEPAFKFPLCLKDSGIIMGRSQIREIITRDNVGDVETGLIFEFLARGEVEKPKIICIDTQQEFEIDKTLIAGERVIVNTNQNNQGIKGYLDGVEYNYYEYKGRRSTWLQLAKGTSGFRRVAKSGLGALNIIIRHTNKRLEIES